MFLHSLIGGHCVASSCIMNNAAVNTLCACVLSGFSRVRLYDARDCSRPGSSAHGILQARILEWAAMPSSRGASRPRVEPASLMSPELAGGGLFTTSATGKLDEDRLGSKRPGFKF